MADDPLYERAETAIGELAAELRDEGVDDVTLVTIFLAASLAHAAMTMPPEAMAKILDCRAAKLRAEMDLPRN